MARRVCELDFADIRGWFEAWGKAMPAESLFPKIGFIIDGVAAGFVYLTDSRLAIIDCFISNPDTDSKTRSDALDAITTALLHAAKFHRCTVVKCDTQIEAIKTRALKHGFRPIGSYECFISEI